MMEIPLFKMPWDEADIEAVSRVIKRGMYWAEGPEVHDFETKLCQYTGAPGVLVCNSGTSALHMALIACGIKHYQEVIVPSFTFIATVNAVKFIGAKPVFADIEDQTLGLDVVDVESKITPKTAAIIAVHYAGHPCQIQELRYLARRRKVLLIEDAAEAFGATFNNISVGKFGDCGILSFCQNKILTTGEGGALVTENKFIYDKAMLVRSHGSNDHINYISLGYNFRMPSMLAALGASQLKRTNFYIQKRREIAQAYNERLAGINGIITPAELQSYWHVYQLYTIRIKDGLRDSVQRHLSDKGIQSKVYFHPVHLMGYYRRRKWEPESLPVTEQISQEVLSLPIYPGMTASDIEHVAEAVKEVVN